MQLEPPSSPQIALLRRCSTIALDSDAEKTIYQLVPKIEDWDLLITLAEKHGLANLLDRHLECLKIEVPKNTRQKLLSLRIRHRRANQARIRAMGEIVETLSKNHIKSVLLKGAALIHVLYPSPELRPMSDIDLLVAPEQAEQAQQHLRDLGYVAENRKVGFPDGHHHLPMASRTLDGVPIHIEVHRDALSGDVANSIQLDNLTAPLTDFEIAGVQCHSLGHTDMLRHLCHHMLEPMEESKLGAIADLYGYACRFQGELDISAIDMQHPLVKNLFSLLHYITPVPEELRSWISIPAAAPPDGVGYGYRPMSQTLAQEKNPILRIAKLLQAPDWWLHGYYVVPPDRSLLMTKYLRHPNQVIKWLIRRVRAKYVDHH
ncbi:MAG: nucleotidyltransferase family protein [bacterium]